MYKILQETYRQYSSSNTLSNAVYETLKLCIIKNILPENHRIKEEEVATILHISRTPVREALNILLRHGLVTLDYKNGYIVHSMNMDECRDIINYVVVLRSESAKIAATSAGNRQLLYLKQKMLSMEKINQYREENNFSGIYIKHQEFHLAISQITNNDYLIKENERINERLLFMHYYYPMEFKKEFNAEIFANSHLKIFNSIENRNPEEAAKAVEKYIVIENVTRHMYCLKTLQEEYYD
ncbi:MAG: GntR family transcriptional regulator [Eubacteriales bacterium]